MSTFRSRSSTGSKTPSKLGLSKSIPQQDQTFDQFKQSREERFLQIEEDIKASKEKELCDLKEKLHDLVFKINSAQSSFAAEERNYLNEKETLSTELKRIKISNDEKSAESRAQHIQDMQNLQDQHEIALKEFAESLQNLQMPSESDNNDVVENARQQLRNEQNKFRESKLEMTNHDEDFSSINQYDTLYISRIASLESKKRELLQTIKDQEAINKQRVTELTMILDENETRFQNETKALQEEMDKIEAKYNYDLKRLVSGLDRNQGKRAATLQKRQERIVQIQQQIDKTESNFKEKLRQANCVAEKLKSALVNANLRKSQQFELERQRSQEQHDLLRNSYALQQNIAKLKKELEKARKENSILRRELSAKLGPRRTASLFA